MSAYSKAVFIVIAGALAFCPPVWSQAIHPGPDEPVIAPAPRTINLTQEQRFIIKEIVLKDLNVQKARADAPETIGDAVPENIDLHAMPPEVAEKVPQGRPHSFFVKDDTAIVLA